MVVSVNIEEKYNILCQNKQKISIQSETQASTEWLYGIQQKCLFKLHWNGKAGCKNSELVQDYI